MKQRKIVVKIISLCMFMNLFYGIDVQAASLRLNKKSATVKAGNSVTIKVKNTKKKAKWSIRSGKKYIRLKAKKRASVRVAGVKKGTAKVQCRIGRKKMVCKVKVTEGEQKMPTVSRPPVTVSPVPTTVPTESPAVTQSPRPSHIPTEDRLMVEPRKEVERDPNEQPTGVYVSWPDRPYYFFGSEIRRRMIEKVTIVDYVHVPSSVIGTMDLSEKQNGSVMAWYADEDGDGRYEMTIGQEGGVVANPDSGYLFYEISYLGDEEEPICGLEHLYTSEVTDMSYMFSCVGARSSEFKTFSLGDWFDTSAAVNMKGMFSSVGWVFFESLNLGKQFDVSKVEDAALMFCAIQRWFDAKCYVNSEELKQWILDRKNVTAWDESFRDSEHIIVES